MGKELQSSEQPNNDPQVHLVRSFGLPVWWYISIGVFFLVILVLLGLQVARDTITPPTSIIYEQKKTQPRNPSSPVSPSHKPVSVSMINTPCYETRFTVDSSLNKVADVCNVSDFLLWEGSSYSFTIVSSTAHSHGALDEAQSYISREGIDYIVEGKRDITLDSKQGDLVVVSYLNMTDMYISVEAPGIHTDGLDNIQSYLIHLSINQPASGINLTRLWDTLSVDWKWK